MEGKGKGNGGFRLRPGGTGTPNLAQAPKFLTGSIVISLSRWGASPPNIFS